jgi:hypothetical protein
LRDVLTMAVFVGNMMVDILGETSGETNGVTA